MDNTIVNATDYAGLMMSIARVLARWEHGNLAEAVNKLQEAAEESGITIELKKPVTITPSGAFHCHTCQLTVKQWFKDDDFVFCPTCCTVYPIQEEPR